MNKKIKVIELLNKIANGEEVPKGIKVNGLDFIWKILDDVAGYFNIEEGHWLEDCISLDSAEDLNTEVEILEDNTEEIEELFVYRTGENDLYNDNFDDMFRKINELVKAVKEIRKDLNK